MEVLKEEDNFLAIGERHSSYENSKIVVLSVPYEYRTSFGKGTKHGPEAILNASAYVEFYDDEFDKELCFDKGIATLIPVAFQGLVDKQALDIVEKRVEKLIENDKFVVCLGGEHTVSYAPIAAHFKKHPDMSILQFDAHSDLRTEYEGSAWSHACVMARAAEFFPTERLVQVGVRAQCKEEAQYIKEKNVKTFYASAIRKKERGENWQKQVAESLSDKVYVTFDIDYFDPAVIPATGTPEPNGFAYSETLDVFREMKKAGKEIVGFDLVELAPIEGLSHPNQTAAQLAYKIMNFAFYYL